MNYHVDATLLESIIKQVNKVSPWTYEEADKRSKEARRNMTQHDHGHNFYSKEDEELTRSNCAACVLSGYGADISKPDATPNHVLWLRDYIETRKIIPSAWLRQGLMDGEDNKPFYETVLRSIRTYGLTTYLDGAKVTITF